jgi:transaldolase
VNVFLGRLKSFVAGNGLGSGTHIGEKATLASQRAIRELRRDLAVPTKQIGASFREGEQVRHLLGIDVMTVPPKVAKAFLDLDVPPAAIADQTSVIYQPPLREGVEPAVARLDTLWDVGDDLVACVGALEQEQLDGFTPDDLVAFLADHGCGDIFPRWSDEQVAASAEEGKIPKLDHWREPLASKAIGLDSLMNLAGLNSFAADQKAMDDRVGSVLASR